MAWVSKKFVKQTIVVGWLAKNQIFIVYGGGKDKHLYKTVDVNISNNTPFSYYLEVFGLSQH
jgi:hypothetical protein